jgi:hypothetical protein
MGGWVGGGRGNGLLSNELGIVGGARRRIGAGRAGMGGGLCVPLLAGTSGDDRYCRLVTLGAATMATLRADVPPFTPHGGSQCTGHSHRNAAFTSRLRRVLLVLPFRSTHFGLDVSRSFLFVARSRVNVRHSMVSSLRAPGA